MENYDDANLEILLIEELEKFKLLVSKFQETNQVVLKNSVQLNEIKQKYEDLSQTLSEIESKLVDPINSDDFVNKDTFQNRKEEIDSQMLINKQALISLNKQLTEFDNQLQALTPNIENLFNIKLNQLVSIESFEKEINDVEQKILKASSNSVEKYEIEDLKKSLGLVIKDIGEIHHLTSEIDKDKIAKLEAKIVYIQRKVKDQLNQYSLKIDLNSEEFTTIKKQFTELVSYAKHLELEKRINEKIITLNRVNNELQLNYKKLSEQIENQKGRNITFTVFIVILTILTVFASMN